MKKNVNKVSNPYRFNSANKFWRSALAELKYTEISDMWNPKFKIGLNSKIITVGSCFAKHIGDWLKAKKFDFVDSEPPPKDLHPDKYKNYGYGIFSFRIGNIYTASMLRQWIDWSLKIKKCPDAYVKEGKKFFDPFRPRVPEGGYSSFQSLRKERMLTLKSIRKSVSESDIFIFTLGLTESWIDLLGYTYAICPGTFCGKFSDKIHFFKNYKYDEIYNDMEQVILNLRTLNPSLCFVLTVSPVPLTATFSENHILVANTYSKSVLRAVAGDLNSKYEFVDYFPSYELISSHPFKGQFFDENLRTVKKSGVNFVMEHFAKGIGLERTNKKENPIGILSTKELNNIPISKSGDEFCDDHILESQNCNHNILSKDTSMTFGISKIESKLCLLGDSHMGCYSAVLRNLNIKHSGGFLMNGSAWRRALFRLNDECFLLPFENLDSQRKWCELYESFFENKNISGSILLTNISNHLHAVPPQFEFYVKEIKGSKALYPTKKDVFKDFTKWACRLHFQLIKSFIDEGLNVICITDPPFQHFRTDRFSKDQNFYKSIETELCDQMSSLGCKIINTRKWTKGFLKRNPSYELDDLMSPRYLNGKRDWVHGSNLFYYNIANYILTENKFIL